MHGTNKGMQHTNLPADMENHQVDHMMCQNHRDESITVTLLGGDARQLAVSAFLAEAGYTVRVMGVGDNEGGSHSGSQYPSGVRLYYQLTRALEGCTAVILPYPVTKDGVTVQCPLDTRQVITLEAICDYLIRHPEVVTFGGRIPAERADRLRQAGCRVVDYEDDEGFLIKNARLTAEGAIMTAMEMTDTALLGAKVAVVGYGRIGQLLAQLLSALGADVTVVARRSESLALAEAQGCHALPIADMLQLCTGYRIIFNTVPARIFEKELLYMMPCDTLIIELASAPGGLDPEGAREATRRCGLQIIRAPSLPGRYAPKDAGRAMADCILAVKDIIPRNPKEKEVSP